MDLHTTVLLVKLLILKEIAFLQYFSIVKENPMQISAATATAAAQLKVKHDYFVNNIRREFIHIVCLIT